MALERPASPFASAAPQRLGRNAGRYLGETIQIQKVLEELNAEALARGWQSECFLQTEQLGLFAYHSPRANAAKRLYISTGIHGDEPAGPLAALDLIRNGPWSDALEVWLCPCLNPTGFALNTRENAAGLDLNRQYLQPRAAEIRSHMAWLEQQPRFDLTLCLHEDWEAQGFYVYELNLDREPSFAEAIVRRVAEVCPIDASPLIEGRPAQGGIIRPSSDPTSRPEWPEAFYLITHKTRVSCTLEAPSDFPLATRVGALVAGVAAAVDRLTGRSKA
jgi:protein MpaA